MALAMMAFLIPAAAFDLMRHRIPNGLTALGMLLGLIWHGISGGVPGLIFSLEGIGVASLTLLFWLGRTLGAGDVKLLGVVGALMGAAFLLWTMLGTIFAGGLLALAAALAHGKLTGRMPLAPAIILGATFAFLRLHPRLLW